jgi:hypothetical protein
MRLARIRFDLLTEPRPESRPVRVPPSPDWL